MKGGAKLDYKFDMSQDSFLSYNLLKMNIKAAVEHASQQGTQIETAFEVLSLLLPPQNSKPKGIQDSKKMGIIRNLCSLMPFAKQEFWHNVPDSDTVRDLLTQPDCK